VLAGPSDQGHFPDDFLTAACDHVTRVHSAATRTDITASSSSTDDDQQNDSRLTLKLAFFGCCSMTSL